LLGVGGTEVLDSKVRRRLGWWRWWGSDEEDVAKQNNPQKREREGERGRRDEWWCQDVAVQQSSPLQSQSLSRKRIIVYIRTPTNFRRSTASILIILTKQHLI
jgi:hypothetical protein